MKAKLMSKMNSEVKKVVERAKKAQSKLHAILHRQDWIEDARKYAEKQGKEVKKLLNSDVTKVKSFLERERKEIVRLQKEIPSEVKKLRGFVKTQRKELEKLLKNLRRATKTGNFKNLTKTKKPTTAKKRKKSGTSAAGASESSGVSHP
jgi:hypothetical protein